MFIKRVSVEEGFLHGLDLHLGRGLTVLIGARGSGKTSIIELIRFCLDVQSYSEGRGEAAKRQALAVLGSGKVTVTLDVEGQEVTYTRSASEDAPRRSPEVSFAMPIILSQNEIEAVGRHSDSRLRLLDGFVPALRDNERNEAAARALISSLTVELRSVLMQAQEAEDHLAKLSDVGASLAEAKKQAEDASAHLKGANKERARLEEIAKATASAAVREDLYKKAEQLLSDRAQRMRHLASQGPLEGWPIAAASVDRLASIRERLTSVGLTLESLASQLGDALTEVRDLRVREQQERISLEDEARSLRAHVEQLSEGAGLLLKRVADLEGSLQRASALREHLAASRASAAGIADRREQELDKLDTLRDTRVNMREEAAGALNSKLGPKIRITVNRFGEVAQYRDALAEALRGSGLQYNVLAPMLARTVSPRELVVAAESEQTQALSEISGISLERAQKLVQHLRSVGTENVLTAPLADTVELALLDGGVYKSADDLSVGQRCTVVLPIILSHTERVLIVDQPEDNLDNAFVAETLVKALRNRPPTSQILFATHNPNIPVLGDANTVVLLASDGKRGEVAHIGNLDDKESVQAITDVMEGGREAFERRAAFYGQKIPRG